MIHRRLRGTADLLVVGPVRGLLAEVPPLLSELTSFAPKAIGLGISFDELTGLRDHFLDTPSEPSVPLTETEVAEVKALSRFGEVRVPNPSMLASLRWASDRAVPVEGVDPSDESYAEMFTDHISYLELVRRTLRERQLTRDPPAAASPEELARAWHARRSPGRGSREFDRAREAAVVDGALRLARNVPSVALVVDRERFEPVVQRLTDAGFR